jgi:DNA-3-methyladenine glycosylase
LKLGLDFYLQEDVIALSRQLLGQMLCTNIDGKFTSGIITETEAYAGISDKASHAFGNRLTSRTAPMFEQGGIAYIYLCYGIHSLFNVVTNIKGIPHAILIRAIHPLEGIPEMLKRRNKTKADVNLASGPGTVAQALGIHYKHSGTSLLGSSIWIEKSNQQFAPEKITIGPRVGVAYAGDHALLPYRFKLKL